MAKILAPLALSVVLSLSVSQTAHAQFGLKDMVKSATDGLTSNESESAVEPLDVPHSIEEYDKGYKNYRKTILQGAGIGAIAGGVAGAALGGSEEAVAIGAAVGGVAGGLVGKEIAKRSKKITKNRKRLTKALEKSEAKRNHVLKVLAMTEDNVADLKVKISELEAAYYAGNLTEEAKVEKISQIQAWRVKMAGAVTEMQADISNQILIMEDAAANLMVHEEPEMQARITEVTAEVNQLGVINDVLISRGTGFEQVDSQIVALQAL